jgi:hypothetical protein
MALVTSKERPNPGQRVRLSLGSQLADSINQSELTGGGPWIVRGAGAAAIARELARQFNALASRHEIHLGVKTGANAVFLHPPADLEPHLIRPAFRGRDLRPFRIIRSLPLLWPCDPGGTPLPELPDGALRHIRAHEKTLRSRADQGAGPLWTLFRTAGASRGPRVVWADLSRSLTAVALAEDDRRIPLNTCYVIQAGAEDVLALAAWLNSSWMRGLARLQADPARGGFARFNARTVGSLPLPASVESDPALVSFARAAGSGIPDQDVLDELTASHLDLPASALRTLASVA